MNVNKEKEMKETAEVAEALELSDRLVTAVLAGETGLMKKALDVARALDMVKRSQRIENVKK